VGDFTVRWDDWKGGDFGNRDPAKADRDQFSGRDVYPYESGLLGVRAGTKLVPVTGIPNHTNVPGPLAFWLKDNTFIVVIGSVPYQAPIAGGAATAWAAYPSTPLRPIRFLRGGGVVYSLSNNTLFKHPTSASTVAVTTPAPLSHIVRWGYYFVGTDANRPWRIWFSTVDASGPHFDTWGANDYIDIGDSEPITAMVPIYNTLYIGKASGWDSVTGVLGTLASVRAVEHGNGPVDPRLASITTDNRIVYWPLGKSPAFFNGTNVTIVGSQEVDLVRQTPPSDSVIVTPTSRRLILAVSDTAKTSVFSYASGAWTRHRFNAPLGGFAPGDIRDGISLPDDVVYAVLGPTIVTEPVRIVSYNHNLNRPGHTTDIHSAPTDVGETDLVAGTVTFPTYWEPIGRQVRVRSVIVQFRKWASGVPSSTNEIRLQIDALGTYQSGDRFGIIKDWIEPCERASSSGTDDSWRVNVGDQGHGNGFRISFPKLVGVALREVIAICDVRTDRT
jgi:hypothetical protein